MSKTLVFNSYEEFLNRPDKSINGVSISFALDYPDFSNQNLTNKGCFNLASCTNCTSCTWCRNCNNCYNCSHSSTCNHCINCNDCYDCDNCINCDDYLHGNNHISSLSAK